jgi:hypothetical protein
MDSKCYRCESTQGLKPVTELLAHLCQFFDDDERAEVQDFISTYPDFTLCRGCRKNIWNGIYPVLNSVEPGHPDPF